MGRYGSFQAHGVEDGHQIAHHTGWFGVNRPKMEFFSIYVVSTFLTVSGKPSLPEAPVSRLDASGAMCKGKKARGNGKGPKARGMWHGMWYGVLGYGVSKKEAGLRLEPSYSRHALDESERSYIYTCKMLWV